MNQQRRHAPGAAPLPRAFPPPSAFRDPMVETRSRVIYRYLDEYEAGSPTAAASLLFEILNSLLEPKDIRSVVEIVPTLAQVYESLGGHPPEGIMVTM